MTQCCELLAKEKLKVTFIKSASAGYLAYLFSLTPCSGKILIGGLVCYDLKVKEKILKISPKLIAKYTPESIEITEELVKKAKNMFTSDIYVGCTGLLKPGGSETSEKPVGTFFIQFYTKTKYIITDVCVKERKQKN